MSAKILRFTQIDKRFRNDPRVKGHGIAIIEAIAEDDYDFYNRGRKKRIMLHQLAKKSNCSESTLKRWVKKLIAWGYIIEVLKANTMSPEPAFRGACWVIAPEYSVAHQRSKNDAPIEVKGQFDLHSYNKKRERISNAYSETHERENCGFENEKMVGNGQAAWPYGGPLLSSERQELVGLPQAHSDVSDPPSWVVEEIPISNYENDFRPRTKGRGAPKKAQHDPSHFPPPTPTPKSGFHSDDLDMKKNFAMAENIVRLDQFKKDSSDDNIAECKAVTPDRAQEFFRSLLE